MHMVATAASHDDRPDRAALSARRGHRGGAAGARHGRCAIGKGRLLREGSRDGHSLARHAPGRQLCGRRTSWPRGASRRRWPTPASPSRSIRRWSSNSRGTTGSCSPWRKAPWAVLAPLCMQHLAARGLLDGGLRLRPDDAARPLHRSRQPGGAARRGRAVRQGYRGDRPERGRRGPPDDGGRVRPMTLSRRALLLGAMALSPAAFAADPDAMAPIQALSQALTQVCSGGAASTVRAALRDPGPGGRAGVRLARRPAALGRSALGVAAAAGAAGAAGRIPQVHGRELRRQFRRPRAVRDAAGEPQYRRRPGGRDAGGAGLRRPGPRSIT